MAPAKFGIFGNLTQTRVHLIKCAANAVDQFLPLCGEADRTCRAVEQRHAQLSLQLLDLLADRGLGAISGDACRPEAASLGHKPDTFQKRQVERPTWTNKV